MQFFVNWAHATIDIFVVNVWKTFPFRAGNRFQLIVILKAYICCLVICFALACVLNLIEGDKLWTKGKNHYYGYTSLDESVWFVLTTMHGVPFGEFMARGLPGRLIGMFCCALGYWFVLFMMCIILINQLPGERSPRLYSVAKRMAKTIWPSYVIFLSIVVGCGCTVGHSVTKDRDGENGWPTGVYFCWTVAHRMPYGDIWPKNKYGYSITVVMMCLGLIYMPYVLALVAVRCPSVEQHEKLLGNIRDRPADALGRGYIVPKEAGGNDSLQEYVMHEYTPSS